ncbi:hypothetical protein KFE25_006940 [Diacronema lutheri]|uniref:NFACT RNA-binding domain-containing protein n=2 Tax=Diacronema lutheri TaxID=2081491 RepID=A0A8J6CHM0_DIALT|nr:hypothetical protein KFE25_006940 [Diacronema lutheri]
MVFYFVGRDPRYLMYMGRDKEENEELIRYGWPEDVWFHVDKHSSAHVYIRLLEGQSSLDDIPEEVIEDCAQLTKLNSIEGCKLNDITIVYTMWSNLKKTGDMATGQVGFHNRAAVRFTLVKRRKNEICNLLNKSKREENPNFADLRDARDRLEIQAKKRAAQAQRLDDKARRQEFDKERDIKSYAGVFEEERMQSNQEILDKVKQAGKTDIQACREMEDDFM